MANRQDTLNRADNPTSIGNPSDYNGTTLLGYTIVGGDNGQIYHDASHQIGTTQGTAAGALAFLLDSGTVAGTATVEVSQLGSYNGLRVRGDGSNNGIDLWFNATTIQFYKTTAGSPATLGSSASVTIAAGDTVSAVDDGSNLSAKVNGVQVIAPFGNTDFNTNTKQGPASIFQGANWWFRNYTFTTASPPPPATLTAADPAAVCTAADTDLYADGTNGSTAPAGGTPPYTNEWFGPDADPDFTPAGSPAHTGDTYSPTMTTTRGWFKVRTTDSAGTPAVVTSVAFSARRLNEKLVVGVLSDSLDFNTPTGGEPSPDTLARELVVSGDRVHEVQVINGGAPGSSTNYWLEDTHPDYVAWTNSNPGNGPVTGGDSLIKWLCDQLEAAGCTDLFIALGTNPTSPFSSYSDHVDDIIAAVTARLTATPRFYLDYPPFGRPGGSYGGTHNAQVLSMVADLAGKVDGVTIFPGDVATNAATGGIVPGVQQDDVHFSDTGAPLRAQSRNRAVAAALYPPPPSSGGGFPGGGW